MAAVEVKLRLFLVSVLDSDKWSTSRSDQFIPENDTTVGVRWVSSRSGLCAMVKNIPATVKVKLFLCFTN
jgi:hypothetical protein